MILSAIERIAQEIAEWGDGWEVERNPDDRGRWVRLTRTHERDVDARIDIEMHQSSNQYLVSARFAVRLDNGRWTPVSIPLRNPITRRALDYINQRLDEIEAGEAMTTLPSRLPITPEPVAAPMRENDGFWDDDEPNTDCDDDGGQCPNCGSDLIVIEGVAMCPESECLWVEDDEVTYALTHAILADDAAGGDGGE